jgi:hypothetical protein
VVIITGYPQVETASEAVRLGAFDYLAKPVEKEALLKIARLAIQQYHLEQGAAELARQYLVASGMIQPIHTLVDFYTHIKGIEYIICVAFFVAFPLFFQYVDKRKSPLRASGRSHRITPQDGKPE